MPTPEPGERWGILGGTFDPVHRGHITIALEVLAIEKLDGVYFVPSYNHPFKRAMVRASFEDRYNMLLLATAHHDCLGVSDIERELDLSGYTLDTILAFRDRFPGVDFYFIAGADILNELDSWHKPHEILKRVTMLVASRPGQIDPAARSTFTGQIEMVETSLIEVSSSAIRKAIASGAPYANVIDEVGPEVKEYMERKGLYR